MEFIEYIFREVRRNKLAKAEAEKLLREYRRTKRVPEAVAESFRATDREPSPQRPGGRTTRSLHETFDACVQSVRMPEPLGSQGARIERSVAERFDVLLAELVLAHLQSMNALTPQGGSLHACLERGNIHTRYERWLEESLRVLRERGYLADANRPGAVQQNRPVQLEALWKEWEQCRPSWALEPALKSQCDLVEPALRLLPQILQGKRLATEVLFPKASVNQVEAVYSGNPGRDFYNELLGNVAAAFLQERTRQDSSAKLRLVEIGAGTGSTSATVMERLKPYERSVEEYCYTDISKTFLLHAQTKFAAQDYLKCKLFNVEKPPAEQGFELGNYDIAIAANVLHATRNIRRTLRNAKALLKPGGLLLLNEMSDNALSMHLTFGLLEGWWLYEDDAIRMPGCPGLTAQSWQQVLEEEGFARVHFPASDSHKFGQQTIVAMSDAVSAQPSAQKRVEANAKLATLSSAPRAATHEPDAKQTHNRVKQAILASLREALKLTDEIIDPEDSFADYGVDSIIAGHVVHLVSRALRIDLATTVVFDYSSVNKLASFIAAEYGSRIEQPVDANVSIDTATPPEDSTPQYSAPLQVKTVEERTHAPRRTAQGPIAIIGMSGRFPQSANVQELWEHLRDGDDLVRKVSRWSPEHLAGYGKEYCEYGGFLDGIDEFDPLFFNISGVEATYTDPQQRLFLQESWRALEDAGYAGKAVEGQRCGVYVGCNGTDHTQLFAGKPPAQAMWGNSPAILSARLPYYLDLHGPAITLDTACSSSLVAMHLACQALWSEEVSLALAGGVYVQSTPSFLFTAGRASMLSSRGRCFTFDDRADGFVPGEGVGAVVMKRLEDALADGDHIYGVIRGSGVNQDGTTNGITAPSARSQEQLHCAVYERFGIDPEHIQMMEAHGTGTKLGDPIEYEALKKAFGRYTQKKQYCALGAVKTNIGHTLAAAGVASVIKVLLSLRERQIPPSLHFETANSHIDFANGPLYVNTRLQTWDVAPDRRRLAAVSSFGFSGTNAHMVIEEGPVTDRHHAAQPGYLIVLSARDAGGLRRQAQQLMEHCRRQDDLDCGNISYTLLMGRKHFNHRLACVARNVPHLVDLLQQWLDGASDAEVHAGRAHERDELDAERLSQGEQSLRACQQAVDSAGYREHLQLVADLYTRGYELPFAELFDNDGYSRLSLPTYPFSKERYWIPSAPARTAQSDSQPAAVLHPLLQENHSTFAEQRYSSRFTGEEFFLRDHVVNGEKILPGAAYLEIARAAMADASGNDGVAVRLRNVVWSSPLCVGSQGAAIDVALRIEDSGEVSFRISNKEGDAGSIPYSQGTASCVAAEDEHIDIEGMRARCDSTLDAAELYATYQSMGIHHGESLRGLRDLSVGANEHGQRFVLARWSLPEAVADTAKQYVLHPAVIDSVFQASLGLSADPSEGDAQRRPIMPFALDELVIARTQAPSGWVYIREATGSTQRVCKLDMDLCDDAGRTCATFRGMNSRRLEARVEAQPAPEKPDDESLLLRPVWDTVCVPFAEMPGRNAQVLLVGGTEQDKLALNRLYPTLQALPASKTGTIDELVHGLRGSQFDQILWIAPQEPFGDARQEGLIEQQRNGVLSCFRLVKALFQAGYASRALEFTVVTANTQAVHRTEAIDPTHASVHGLIGALAKEQPRWKVRSVDLDRNAPPSWEQVLRLPPDPQGDAWCHRGGEWYRQELMPCELSATAQPVYRKAGVYVLVGGAGGIGEAFSEYLVRQWNAHVIWIGRRAENEEIRARRARLAKFGPEPLYLQADATDRADMERAYARIKAQYGRINGVVHSAIVLLDRSLLNMDEARFSRALEAKVDVCVRLAQVFAAETPDFVLYFSGLQSFGKLPGQSNYAAGCTFKDAHAHELSRAWNCPVKVMNWGYWGSVGIVASDQHRARMEQAGVASIETEDGIAALHLLLSGPFDQLGFIKVKDKAQWGSRTVREKIVPQPSSVPSLIETVPAPQATLPFALSENEIWSEIDACLAKLLLVQLSTLGFGDRKFASLEQWSASIGMPPLLQRWLHSSVLDLRARGLIEIDADGKLPKLAIALDAQAAWQHWDERRAVWLKRDDVAAHVTLVNATLRGLPRILKGEVAATDVMFPRSSMALVEGIYKHNALADYFNGVLGDWLVAYVQERIEQDAGTRLRLLEIGAGTGGTSAGLFEKLWAHRERIEEYCYTDLSKAFLLHAQEHYASRAPYLKCQLFDAERSPAEQQLRVGGYDVVIATNVLHATKNIRQTLRNAKALLQGNGLLVINEIVATNLTAQLTFGLLDGWWRFEDDALRIDGCPALTARSWQQVLQEEGFRRIALPAAHAAAFGQQIIVAESDGIARRPLAASTQPQRAANEQRSRQSVEVGAASAVKEEPARPLDIDAVKEKGTLHLRKLVAETLKIDVHEIDAREPLESYGIDSILVVRLTDVLKERIPNVTSTLFFEHQTIAGLVQHLIDKECASFAQLLGVQAQPALVTPSTARTSIPQRSKKNSARIEPFVLQRTTQDNPAPAADRSIAIIGLSGRYAKANTLQEYWDNLQSGRDCIDEIPAERWSLENFYHPDIEQAVAQGKSYCKWGGFIDGFAEFDALFFSISPAEAEGMDPQERLFMQSCWEVIEDAGYTREELGTRHRGRVGVFAGVTKGGFELYGPQLWQQGEKTFPRTSFSSVANRVSYFLNLHGPSMPIDTMCSSSLTAIHEACEHLLRGECELAIAGGVNVNVHPSSYVGLCVIHMLSATGRCKSFGAGGDGMVPGEGVGTVLLKSLSAAIADGDHIHGVIRSTSINHGGKTNGYTVPNPQAQRQLIRDALDKAGLNARAVSYIEAHGTGTELGDPIEIAGLAQAFEQDTQEKQFCAIGSVKSNIGHAESAAGIAGLTKILLQMKHGVIAPSLHARELNRNITFERTPFVVPRELAQWRRPLVTLDGVTREYPRIAGISSFGAGGSNAHVVIEEYVETRMELTATGPALIVLSAKDEQRLKQRADQLRRAIESGCCKEEELASIAYTLQVGREAMEQRLGLLARSLEDLREKLARYVNGEAHINDLYRAEAKSEKGMLALLNADEDTSSLMETWLAKGKYGNLLELWVKGLTFDWRRLYGDRTPRRVSLPTYPFAKERYWLSLQAQPAARVRTGTPRLHPLLHENASDLSEQRYVSEFSGEEFFLCDHQVNGTRILPGVAFLEMAREALSRGAGLRLEPGAAMGLKNVAWPQSLSVEEGGVRVYTGLYEQAGPLDQVDFEIYTEVAGRARVIHSQGTALALQVGKQEVVDLQGLLGQVRHEVAVEKCYEVLRAGGVEHGAALQGLRGVKLGESSTGGKFVLAEIEIPAQVNAACGEYVLHPSVMDAALQASVALSMDQESTPQAGSSAAWIPYALDELLMFGEASPRSWACIRQGASRGDQVRKLDIDLCDDNGVVWARLQGLSARQLKQKAVDHNVQLLKERWQLGEFSTRSSALRSFGQRWVVLCEQEGQSDRYEQYVQAVESSISGARCIRLNSQRQAAARRYEDHAIQLMQSVQELVRGKVTAEVLIQVVIDAAEEAGRGVLRALGGLLKTAQLENPKLQGQVIEIEGALSDQDLVRSLAIAASRADDTEIRFRGEQAWLRKFESIAETQTDVKPWKRDGVYFISGGAGALGLLFAQEIATQASGVTLLLGGRNTAGQELEQRMQLLRESGARVQYMAVDVGDRHSVEQAMAQIKREQGRLDGVIHSAGVLRDSFLLKKSEADLQTVFAAKVAGVVNLDEATRHEALDFFAVFSSASAVFGGIGQADYAMANAFMDEYVRDREKLVREGKRQGRSLCIDWPLWSEGGMKLGEDAERQMRREAGLVALSRAEGLQAFYAALQSQEPRVLVLAVRDEPRRAPAAPTPMAEPLEDAERFEPGALSDAELSRRTLHYFKKLLAAPLKMEVARIEADVAMEKYGIDSIMVLQLTRRLEEHFGSLSKTLFFEYGTLEELSRHFLESHRPQLLKCLGMQEGGAKRATPPQRKIEASQPRAVERQPRRSRLKKELRQEAPVASAAQQIAIVGVSGRYAQARNIQEYWDNLRAGKDCIEEIPAQRWDYRRHFEPQKGTPGKSYSKWGGFVPGVDEFDALFFNISPLEASFMDPQERLFLQCVYETLEDAGYTRESLQSQSVGAVGVFVGVMYEEYQLYGAQAQALGQGVALSGNASSIANRVSYFCNFRGPSLALDTMCSSSLTAIHLACESLRRGECSAAIAGGVNVNVHPNKYLALSQGQFASSKGRCQSFGDGGDGYVPGEGIGAVLLKGLHQAIEDGDQIYGVIRGTSINHGGKTNGYTVPNPQAQAQVIEEALQKAGISARQISYIEAHGTGTSLGDPIEIAGLSKAFSRWTQDQRFCAIGSAKSSIGHCESAAGIAGVTKILLQMKHGLLAPSLHAEELNPHIDFANSPFVVQRELGEWRRPLIEVNGETREYPRLAGISAFGAGGSNAHVVIEEYLPRDAEPGVHLKSTVPALIVLSAKDEQRLRERADQLRQALDGGRYTESDLAAIAYTLQVGREAMEQRLGLLVTSLADLREKLTRYASDAAGSEDLYRGEVKRNKEMVSVFAADDELQEAIAKWLERGKYGKLLEVWVKGMVLDWRRLYGERTPRRLSLPGYPFATDRHWFTAAAGDSRCVDVDAAAKPTECPVAAVAGRSARILTKQWLSSPASIETAALQSAIIVATRDTELLANKVAALFSRSHVIDADKSEELDWGSFDTWIDLAGCGATHDASAQWMAQLQRWIQHGREHSRLALCVTRGLESLDNPQANLAGALQAGLYRMLQNEYRNLCSRHMDTDLSPDDSSLVEQIRRECMLREDSNAEICYRNGLRYRACLGETEQATHAIAAPTFAEDDVLWVTGGTQGLGSLCAQHLVSRYGVRRVVLSGRTVLPPRNQWDVHRHRCTDLARKIAVVEALEAQGARVRVSAVCLTDAEAMRAEVLEIRRTLGRIAGVLHCAGTVDLQTPAFIYKSATDIEQVLAPKVTGLDNLIRCIEDEPLQFVILFSSVSAAVPSLAVGQSDYAVANSYMDYIAQAHRPHLPITSVQWSSWKETGFGETTSKPFQEAGLLSQLNAEGLEFLDQVIANRWGPVVLPAVVDAARWQPERLMLKHSRQVSPAKREQQRSTPTHGESPLCCEVSAWVRSTFAAALRIDESKLDDETQLQDYGVDSIILVQLMKPVSQLIGEAVDPSILFEYSTIKSFAAWLASTHAEAFRSAAALPQEHERTVDAVVAQVAEPVPEPIPQLPDSDSSAEDIAVVGMSCRFPGARNLDEYWQLLAQGRSAIGAVSAERGQVREGCYAGLLDNITHFDPAFFQIPDSDAAVIDPQALVVLEESLNTFCHAGLPLRDVKGSNIGVYLGGRSRHRPDAAGLAEARNPIVAVGQNYLAANISRFFDLRGPSLVLDTACSSALVAMNMAVQALRCGEIDAALVGGVSLLNTDTDLALFDQRGLLRKEPQFHIFDKRAGGAIYAEGAGMVLLKTSRQARKDRDTVYAVIKGIAVNNDGRTVGPSAPNVQAQKDVMHAALRKSGLRAQDVEYIDVNGSGSEIPDLLELRAIEAVYRSTGTPVCELGSMKPNIGHPLCAGGIASFIKVVLMLRRRQRVPFLSAEQPNAHYKFETSPFRFARSLAPWENAQATAAINCFADGGTNAHVILQAHAEDSHAGELRQPIAPPVLERVDIGRLNRPVAATVAVRENNVLGFWKRSRPTVAKQVARKSLWQRVEKVAGGL